MKRHTILWFFLSLACGGATAQMDFKLFEPDSTRGGRHYAPCMMPNKYECRKEEVPPNWGTTTVKLPEYRQLKMELIMPHPNFGVDWEKYDLETVELITRPQEAGFQAVTPRGDRVTETTEELPNSHRNWQPGKSAKSLRDAQHWKWSISAPRYYTKVKTVDTTRFELVVTPEKKTHFQYLKPKGGYPSPTLPDHLKCKRVSYFVRTGSHRTQTFSNPATKSTYESCLLQHKGGEVLHHEVLSEKEVKELLPRIKGALQTLGYSPGDNKKIDRDFILSMTHFQKENELPIGQFDKETLRKLGVIKQ